MLIELIAKSLGKKVYLVKVPFFETFLKLVKPSFHKRLYESLEVDNFLTMQRLFERAAEVARSEIPNQVGNDVSVVGNEVSVVGNEVSVAENEVSVAENDGTSSSGLNSSSSSGLNSSSFSGLNSSSSSGLPRGSTKMPYSVEEGIRLMIKGESV
jgi:hypothetical protein